MSLSKKLFQGVLESEKIPIPESEFKFNPTRRWRADYCWIDHKVILEVEGAVWQNGRHTRGSGFVKDMEKYNSAAVLGYRIIRVTPSDLLKKETMQMIKLILRI